jgi:hypothetical protein
MKMSLAASATGNMQFAGGEFEMLPDNQAGTSGDRDMSIEEIIDLDQGFSSLSAIDDGSLTLSGMSAIAPPFTNAAFMVPGFNGGIVEIYGGDNKLLLSAELSTSALQGALGTSDPQALFLAFGEVTGGSLAPRLDPDSLQLRVKYPQISGGFTISPAPIPQLAPFTTWTSTVEVMATTVVIPEPSLATSLSAIAWMFLSARRRRRP